MRVLSVGDHIEVEIPDERKLVFYDNTVTDFSLTNISSISPEVLIGSKRARWCNTNIELVSSGEQLTSQFSSVKQQATNINFDYDKITVLLDIFDLQWVNIYIERDSGNRVISHEKLSILKEAIQQMYREDGTLTTPRIIVKKFPTAILGRYYYFNPGTVYLNNELSAFSAGSWQQSVDAVKYILMHEKEHDNQSNAANCTYHKKKARIAALLEGAANEAPFRFKSSVRKNMARFVEQITLGPGVDLPRSYSNWRELDGLKNPNLYYFSDISRSMNEGYGINQIINDIGNGEYTPQARGFTELENMIIHYRSKGEIFAHNNLKDKTYLFTGFDFDENEITTFLGSLIDYRGGASYINSFTHDKISINQNFNVSLNKFDYQILELPKSSSSAPVIIRIPKDKEKYRSQVVDQLGDKGLAHDFSKFEYIPITRNSNNETFTYLRLDRTKGEKPLIIFDNDVLGQPVPSEREWRDVLPVANINIPVASFKHEISANFNASKEVDEGGEILIEVTGMKNFWKTPEGIVTSRGRTFNIANQSSIDFTVSSLSVPPCEESVEESVYVRYEDFMGEAVEKTFNVIVNSTETCPEE